jgi:nitrite reductase (cytochrome c-552)
MRGRSADTGELMLKNSLFVAIAPAANPDAELVDQMRQLHCKAQFMWDFVSAENSMGFHTPDYSMRILADSTNLARQAQMLAARSVNDISFLETGTCFSATPQ